MSNGDVGTDGYHHPESEADIAELIARARSRKEKLRVIGSGHSEPEAIMPRLEIPGLYRTVPPPEGYVALMMDRLRGLTLHPSEDGKSALAEVEAGRNVGRNPYDPRKVSSWANSINWNLQRANFALSDLGGISHQTISGFLSTGSAGGSVRHSIWDDVERIRFIDGRGVTHDVSRGDELFFAVGVSLGLLGVITKVWLRAGTTYNIAGQETKRRVADCGVDFFGDGDGVPFERYLKDTPYARQMWWPQHDFERMVMWQATRLPPTPAFTPKPYEELGRSPRVQSLAGCLLYTVLGNLDDLTVVPGKLGFWRAQLDAELEGDPDPNECQRRDFTRVGREQVLAAIKDALRSAAQRRSDVFSRESEHVGGLVGVAESLQSFVSGSFVGRAAADVFADAMVAIVKAILDGLLSPTLAKVVGDAIKALLPDFIDELLGLFVPLDGAAGPQIFQDCWFCGLPMDNQMDDQLWPTVFTELWLPLDKARPVMRALRDHYRASDVGGGAREALARTGTFSCEVYAAKANPFWLSPAYEQDSVRIDLFWFGLNAGDPAKDFFPPFWELLKPFGFRPHLGKVLPAPAAEWAPYLKEAFPKLPRFLELRAELDPDGIFATPYWQEHLGFEVGGGR